MAERETCPRCGAFVWRDSVDVGVGIIYGPYGCPDCGWSSDAEYDRSRGESPAQKEHPDRHIDQWGGSSKIRGDEPAEELLRGFEAAKEKL